MLAIFLIVLSVVLYGYSLFRLIMILVIQDQQYRQDLNYLSTQQIDYSYFHQVNQPRDLEIASFDVAGGREGRYDFIFNIINPNANFFGAQVTFQLISGGEILAEKTGFILPGEEKYFGFFGQETQDTANAMIKIAKVNWQRVHNFKDYSAEHLKFNITDIEFKPAEDLKIRGELPVSTLNFKITNNSAYSYWHVGIFMALLSVDRVVGGSFIALDQFQSGQTRNVEMRWYDSLPSVTDYKILPEVNILDAAGYMPVK